MKICRQVFIAIGLTIGVAFTGCSNSFQTYKEKEIVQMEEEIENLKTELNSLQEKLIEKKNEYQALEDEKNESNNQYEDALDLSYISINKNKVSPNILPINEYGLNLNVFCDVWDGMKIEIVEYSKKEFGGHKGADAPTKFKISFNDKFVEFEGVVYASPLNGEPIAEYIAGKFGDIRARYKRGIMLYDKASIISIFDLLGIGCTFYDDKSVDFYRVDNE